MKKHMVMKITSFITRKKFQEAVLRVQSLALCSGISPKGFTGLKTNGSQLASEISLLASILS